MTEAQVSERYGQYWNCLRRFGLQQGVESLYKPTCKLSAGRLMITANVGTTAPRAECRKSQWFRLQLC
eukprot:6492206-Amphidinium_carterae.2